MRSSISIARPITAASSSVRDARRIAPVDQISIDALRKIGPGETRGHLSSYSGPNMTEDKPHSTSRRNPINNLSEFRSRHEGRFDKLLSYSTTKRGRENIDDRTLQTLLKRNARLRYATNSDARIAFAIAASREMKQSAFREASSDFHFLTFTPLRLPSGLQLAVKLQDAARFDAHSAKAWMQMAMSGYHYFGVIEPSFFSNWRLEAGQKDQTIHWHFHLVVWNCSANLMDQWVSYANRFFAPLFPGPQPAHARHVSEATAIAKTLYLLKAPQSDHRVIAKAQRGYEKIDPETGEVLSEPTLTYDSKKQALRPGDAIKMCKVLDERTIPELILAGGAGVRLAQLIEQRATRMLQRKQKARDKKFNGPLYHA